MSWFTVLKKDKKIKLDPAFQVGTDDESRWDKKQQSKYIRSVLLGSAPSPFVVVNCELAYQTNLERGSNNASIEYFDGLRRLYIWLSIDGNNRAISLRNFKDGKVTIPPGVYYLKNGVPVIIKKGENNRFSTMERSLREQFLKSEVLVAEYEDVLWSDLGPLFRNINDGIHLNPQMNRQSNPSSIAEYVRDVRSKFKKSLKNLYGNKDFIMLKGDEWIAKCMAFVVYGGNTGRSILDSMYENPNIASTTVRPSLKTGSEFTRVLKNVLKDIKKGVSNLSANSIFDYFVINWSWSQENIRVVDRKKVYDKWLEVVSGMTSDESAIHPSPKVDEQGVLDEEGEIKDQVVYNWKLIVRKGEATNSVFGDYRRKTIREKIESELFGNGSLVQTSDDDYYTPDEKRIMWERQKGICPCGREDCVRNIPLEEICNGSKWHGDAIDPRANGGLHTLENGQLMCKVGNQKKSKSIGIAV